MIFVATRRIETRFATEEREFAQPLTPGRIPMREDGTVARGEDAVEAWLAEQLEARPLPELDDAWRPGDPIDEARLEALNARAELAWLREKVSEYFGWARAHSIHGETTATEVVLTLVARSA